MNGRLSIIDDMSDSRNKSRVIVQIGQLQGVWRIELCRYRPRRSDRQNRWYWPCFVKPFADYLVDQGNTFVDASDAAHEILKARFLSAEAIDKQTGQRFIYTRSSAALDTSEFNDYLDRCAAFLGEECGISVPEPDIYHEPSGRQEAATSTNY